MEKNTFREMKFSEDSFHIMKRIFHETNLSQGEIWTIFYGKTGGNPGRIPLKWSASDTLGWKQFLTYYNEAGYKKMTSAYGAIWNDLRCFPVAETGMKFENSWMFERYYGGKRGHEGTDIIPPVNISGYYRIISMTDGVVEQIGWLPKGGYRIGIRGPSGAYFYYAHLDSYSRNYQPGDRVSAGEVLGTMGDTGYGEEGSRGKFDVHLHLGIYISTSQYNELSVNPYWILRFLQKESLNKH